MRTSPIAAFFAIFASLLLVLAPVSYAQQLSGTGSQKDTDNEAVPDSSQTVKEVKLQVSGNGEVTVLDADNELSNTETAGTISPQDNTCSEAVLLNLGTEYYSYINYKGDIDWDKWNVPSKGWLNVKLEVPSPNNYELEVYSTCSIYVCKSTNPYWFDENCDVYVTSPGYMYAKIYGNGNSYSSSKKYYITGSFKPDKQYDLMAYGFAVTPSSPKDTDSISVTYEIKNSGADDITSSFNFKLYIDDQLKETCVAGSGLKAGWYSHCTKSGITLSQGSHTLKMVADADNNIAETNENNNIKTQSLSVSHVNKHDLTPGNFIVQPSSPKSSDSITIEYTTVNLGIDDINSHFTSKLYIDNSLKQTCNFNSGLKHAGWGICSISNINLGEGTHVLKNVVDADNEIAETDENNNALTQNLPVASSCPPNKPYKYDGTCHTCAQNELECGGACYNKQTGCSYGEPFCGADNTAYCCSSTHPYACSSENTCFQKTEYCDGRPIYQCQDKKWVCIDKGATGTCDGSSINCCPKEYPYFWKSDNRCHTTQFQQANCQFPDGSSSQCDCDTNADCPSNKPYCGQTYGIRTSKGYHECLPSLPQYCGDGTCNNGETYNTCSQDCTAPTGTIKADVYNPNTQAAVSGARISVDSVFKTTTDANGKASIEASYGSRNVKIECPDSKLCGERTIKVDGTEYANFACNCNPIGDLDGDGFTDADETLLGTDPMDASSNFGSTFASDSVDLLACIPTPASFFILWKEYKKSGSIIQSHRLVVNSLNTTSVTSASLDGGPYFVAQALAAAGFEAEGAEVIVNPINVTLENVMKKAEYVDGIRMQDGLLLIATDKDGQTTALIAIGAGCVGAFSGAVYGIGQGLFDDVKGVIDGIWFLITHLDDVKKIWSGAVELVNGIRELFSKPGEAFWSMFTGILEKGQGINLFKNDRTNNPDPYRHFQVGFVYGFVTGYLVEQVALGAAILKNVAKFFKLGQLFGKGGKATKLLEKLNIIKASEEFGAEIAEKLSKLKYLKEGIDNWLDSEVKGLARIMKHNEGWLKGLSETEAKIAAKHADDLVAAGKITDEAFGDLTKTKLGQHTLKSADATTDLLAKQSKLVEKWGVKKADEVVTKGWFGSGTTERIAELNKIVKAMPENIVDDFDSGRAVKFLGDKKLVEAAEDITKGVDNLAISRVVSDINGYEKLLEYAKAVKKLDPNIVNPLSDIGQHQLLKVYKSATLSTKVGDATIKDVAILKKGYHDFALDEGFGWEHIKAGKHDLQIKQVLELSDADNAVKDVIAEVIETGNVKHFPGDSYEITKKVVRGQKSHDITVIISDRQGRVGSIQTAHPL